MAEKAQKRIGTLGKWAFIGFAALSDITQILLDFFAVGAAVNRIIDIIVAMIMLGIMSLVFKASFVDESKLYLSLLATIVGEEIPVVDALPFWVLDAWYIVRAINKRDDTMIQMEDEKETNAEIVARQLQEEAYKEQIKKELQSRN